MYGLDFLVHELVHAYDAAYARFPQGSVFIAADIRGHGGNSAALGVQQGDAIRNITGGAGYIQFHQNTGSAAGAFYLSGNGGRARINGSEYEPYLNFDASRVVPTAPETVR